MAFQRMEGFMGSVPQRFIDQNVGICPMCGTNAPHWALDMKMQMSMEGNLYLFQCERCKCVISSPVPDVTGYNNTVLTTTGLMKKLSGKENGVIYMKIQDVGMAQENKFYEGKEYTLQELNQMAAVVARNQAAAAAQAYPNGWQATANGTTAWQTPIQPQAAPQWQAPPQPQAAPQWQAPPQPQAAPVYAQYCPHCGQRRDHDGFFCTNCGARVW